MQYLHPTYFGHLFYLFILHLYFHLCLFCICISNLYLSCLKSFYSCNICSPLTLVTGIQRPHSPHALDIVSSISFYHISFSNISYFQTYLCPIFLSLFPNALLLLTLFSPCLYISFTLRSLMVVLLFF